MYNDIHSRQCIVAGGDDQLMRLDDDCGQVEGFDRLDADWEPEWAPIVIIERKMAEPLPREVLPITRYILA